MTTLLIVYAIIAGLATVQAVKMVRRDVGWRKPKRKSTLAL